MAGHWRDGRRVPIAPMGGAMRSIGRPTQEDDTQPRKPTLTPGSGRIQEQNERVKSVGDRFCTIILEAGKSFGERFVSFGS